jgi:hypothetical protein
MHSSAEAPTYPAQDHVQMGQLGAAGWSRDLLAAIEQRMHSFHAPQFNGMQVGKSLAQPDELPVLVCVFDLGAVEAAGSLIHEAAQLCARAPEPALGLQVEVLPQWPQQQGEQRVLAELIITIEIISDCEGLHATGK